MGFTLLVSRSEYPKGNLFLLKVFLVHNQSEKKKFSKNFQIFLLWMEMANNFFLKNYELKTPSVEMTFGIQIQAVWAILH